MYNQWLKNIKIKIKDNACSFYTKADSISPFLIDCVSNRLFWKSWAKLWEAINCFNIKDENHIHESILFGFQIVVMVPLS